MKIKIFSGHFSKKGYLYQDRIITPIQLGKEITGIDLGITGDNTGTNISKKNPYYAELTAQYRVRKNYDLQDIDYIGFCHYRRFFSKKFSLINFIKNIKISRIDILNMHIFYSQFSKEAIEKNNNAFVSHIQKKNFDICITKPRTLIKEGFVQTLNKIFPGIWDITLQKILEKDSKYKLRKNRKILYACNMFIMKKNLFLEYSDRLFDILFSIENEVKKQGLIFNNPDTRVYGFLGEALLNVRIDNKKRTSNIKIIKSNILFLK